MLKLILMGKKIFHYNFTLKIFVYLNLCILNWKKLGSPLVRPRVKILDSESQPLVEQDDYLAGICRGPVRALPAHC